MQQSPRQRSTAVTARVQREGRYEHLAILVLQAISVLVSYCTLIQDFCDGGQRETLPDSSLRKNYPCSGSRHEKAAYILLHTPETLTDLVSLQYPDTWASFVNFAMLVRLPLALVLPHAIYERLTVAILFGVRLTPMTVHITRWLDPPPNQSALWFMTISPATELLTFYVANPCPNPLHEGLYGIISVAGYWVMAKVLYSDRLTQMGIRPSMVVIRQALAVCLTTYLAVVWQRRQRRAWAGGAGARGRSSSGAAGPMHGSTSNATGAGPEETCSGWKGQGAKDVGNSSGSSAAAGLCADTHPAMGLPCGLDHGSHQPRDPVAVSTAPPASTSSTDGALNLARRLSQPGSSPDGSHLPPYRPFLQFRTSHIKIPHAHPSDLPPDFQHRLQQLLARCGQERAGGPTSQPGSSVPARASRHLLHAVYVREGCIELVLRTEDWGEVAPESGRRADCEQGPNGSCSSSSAVVAGAAVGGHGMLDRGAGPLWDAGEVLRALQLPAARVVQPPGQQEQEAARAPLQVLSVIPRVFYVGPCRGGGDDPEGSLAGAALSLTAEVQLLGAVGARGELEVNLLYGPRRLPARTTWLPPAPDRDGVQQRTERGLSGQALSGVRGSGGRAALVVELEVVLPGGADGGVEAALVEFRCGGRPMCVLPVLLTRQQGVAEELGPAARAWQQHQQGRCQQEQEQAQRWQHSDGFTAVDELHVPDDLGELLMDLGSWEHHLHACLRGASGAQHDRRALSSHPSLAQLSVLGAHLLQHAEACGLSRTAEWIREGLGALGEQQERKEAQGQEQEQGQAQGQGRAQGQQRQHASCPLTGCHANGTAQSSGALNAAEAAAASGMEISVLARVLAGLRWWWRGVAPASVVEQGFQVFESFCLVLLVLKGETGSACVLIAGGMGTLVLLSRAFLTHGSWARLLAAFRAPRYMGYTLHKLSGAAGWPMARPELLWGLSEAIYDGVLLPLCCPLPPRLAVPLLLANAAALTAVLTAIGPPPPGVLGAGVSSAGGSGDRSSNPLPAALVGLRLLVLGLATMATVHSRRGQGHGHGRAHGHGHVGHVGQGMTGRRVVAAVGRQAAAAGGVCGRSAPAAPKESFGKLSSAAAGGGGVMGAGAKEKDV